MNQPSETTDPQQQSLRGSEADTMDFEQGDAVGDRASPEGLLSAHRDQLMHYIFSMVSRRPDAEDLCQRCCVVMWKKFDQYRLSPSSNTSC